MDVLVDLDGTLFDPKPGLIRSVQYALGRLGFPVPSADELLWLIGPPFRVSFPKLLGTPHLTEAAIAHYRESYFSGAMYDAVVYDGVPAALDAMRAAGCRLFVATSKPHCYARPILERFDLAHRFAGIYRPELDGTNDQKHDLIAHIIAREGVARKRAVMSSTWRQPPATASPAWASHGATAQPLNSPMQAPARYAIRLPALRRWCSACADGSVLIRTAAGPIVAWRSNRQFCHVGYVCGKCLVRPTIP